MSTFHVTTPTLCRLSEIAIAKHLWQQTSLKQHLKAYINAHYATNSLRNQAYGLMRSAVDIVMNDFILPKPVKEELKFAVGSIGHKMHGWLCENTWVYGPSSTGLRRESLVLDRGACVDYVHWTAYGGVDKVETLRALYFAGILRTNNQTWLALTEYCVEDCLRDLRAKLPNIDDLMNQIVMPRLAADLRDVTLHVYWMAVTRGGGESAMLSIFRTFPPEHYDKTYSTDENMFMNAMRKQDYTAVRYFWGLIKDNQRMRVLAKSCEQMLAGDHFDWPSSGGLTIFLSQQLSHYGLADLRMKIMGYPAILANLLSWPYDYLFMRAINEVLKDQDIMNYFWIIEEIIRNAMFARSKQLTDHDLKYHKIWYTIWEMNPRNFKNSIDYRHVRDLAQLEEFQSLNCILRDPELKHKRRNFLQNLTTDKIWKVTRPIVDNFITQVLLPGEEWFAKAFSWLDDVEVDADDKIESEG